MNSGEVNRSVADEVGTVQFFHPSGNSLPGAVLEKLAAEVTAAHADGAVKVILLRSGGDGPFCAGASFDELKGLSTLTDANKFFQGFAKVMLAMTQGPKPVVVRVQGKAVGGGVGLIAAADYAVASETAQIRLSEIAIGIGPFTIGPVVARKIGDAAFGELAWSADWRDSAWARARGLFQETHATAEALDAATVAICKKLASYSAPAALELKRLTWGGTEHWKTLLNERASITAKLVLTPEAKAALKGK